MKVRDYKYVNGRGWVLIVQGDELVHKPLDCGSKIVSGGTTFTINGVERTKYDDDWWSKHIGLVLSPNNLVPDCFNTEEEIEIIPEHEEQKK